MHLAHEYAEVNGVRLHYVAAGEGPLILFVHGFPEFWYQWKNQLSEFSRHFRTVAVDMRGYGLSSKPEGIEAYRMERLVEDLRALAQHLEAPRFTLVGHDWGGFVAWNFALTHPDLLAKLVIVNAPHPAIFPRLLHGNEEQRRASEYMLRFRSPGAEQALAADGYELLLRILVKPAGLSEEDKQEYLKAWSQPGALTGGLNYYRAAGLGPASEGEPPAPEPDPELMRVKTPTLVIWGDLDAALPLCNLEGLGDWVENLQLRRIPDAGHWVIHQRPELVNRYLGEFLAGS